MSTATVRHARSTRSGHAVTEQNPRHGVASASRRDRVKSVVLGVAGISGMLCILWVIIALAFGLTAIVFKTGSMAPTIPTGSLAITRPIAAADIRTGDVVTVPVPGQVLPVTHRVVSVSNDPVSPGSRVLVLKGDDNRTPDQIPYTVSNAKIVIFSVPVVGTILSLLRTPLYLGATVLLVAGLLFWAFWPNKNAPRYARTNSAISPSPRKTSA